MPYHPYKSPAETIPYRFVIRSGHKELHIDLSGHIGKLKPVAREDHKWSAELREAG